VDFANYYEENIMEESENSKKNEEIIEEASLEQIPSIEEPPSALSNLPMELTVELAKISMTLEKLMQLQPGNFLELSTSLENPVNITVNGKKIARAELATLGETLGIRILEI
jgi:flagellar motor switch protein FliN/FliY